MAPGTVGTHRKAPHAVPARDPPRTRQGDNGPVAVKIKLKRMGKMRNAQYRIVVADAHLLVQ